MIRDIVSNSMKLSSIIVTLSILIPILTSQTNLSSAAQARFIAGLSGSQEVPPIDTNATGSASFLTNLSDMIMYTVNVTNLANITDMGIHIGKQGETGPVVVTLFSSQSPSSEVNGTLSQGNITSTDFKGPLVGKQLSDLVNLMRSGDSYVNIMTEQKPKGEIRGQIGFEGIDETGTGLGETIIIPPVEEVD